MVAKVYPLDLQGNSYYCAPMILLFFSETELGLQEGIDVMSKYCEKWKLVFNVNKTKVMVFRKRGRL